MNYTYVYVYYITTEDRALYCGQTDDMHKRYGQHSRQSQFFEMFQELHHLRVSKDKVDTLETKIIKQLHPIYNWKDATTKSKLYNENTNTKISTLFPQRVTVKDGDGSILFQVDTIDFVSAVGSVAMIEPQKFDLHKVIITQKLENINSDYENLVGYSDESVKELKRRLRIAKDYKIFNRMMFTKRSFVNDITGVVVKDIFVGEMCKLHKIKSNDMFKLIDGVDKKYVDTKGWRPLS